MEHQELLQEISTFLQKGRSPKVKELVQKAIDSVLPPKSILEEGLLAGMGIIGEKFKNNEVFVPEVLIAARAMNGGVEVLKPHLVEAGVETKGVVVIGTVKGDLHDIGKNLVKLMVKGKGLEVIDLGVDMAPEQFVAAKEHNADIISSSPPLAR
ncbi:B12-binding domain-containing protein [Acutalibacter sp. 1XD8-36]|uniref:B12-binding domain-containing protein n=1 Tax=Acutalibacter sp. 1XD8-36 TaxID=2320852 RepID=UPI00261E9E82|nr:B12-binding domain-containing protein [Acutalibacter sp. 1XD8-36]